MTIEEILANRELATLKKKSEVQKSDLSAVLFDAVSKAAADNITTLEVLIYEATVSRKRNEFMFEQYKNGFVLNHSVGMRYVKIFFCYDNDAPEYAADKENYNKYYPQILNKEAADARSYFWAITEAKNIEGSAVVKGSNFLTPVLSVEVIDEDTIKVKCAISPSNILDSHGDVHIPGLWKKAVNEGQYDLLLQEHEMDFDKVITDSVSGDLKVYTENIPVKELLSRFTVANKNIGAAAGTPNDEPPAGTQKSNDLPTVDWSKVLNNF